MMTQYPIMITYYLNDGYGGSRPIVMRFDTAELIDMSWEEAKDHMENTVHQHMIENIDTSVDGRSINSLCEAWARLPHKSEDLQWTKED